MNQTDSLALRFEQRRENFQNAYLALKKSVTTPIQEDRDVSGIIKDFEICYELSWKAAKLYLEVLGHQTSSARHVFSMLFQLGLIGSETAWIQMISDRNETVRTYNRHLASSLIAHIEKSYVGLFDELLVLLLKKHI